MSITRLPESLSAHVRRKVKLCKQCKEKPRANASAVVCGLDCALKLAQAKREKAERRAAAVERKETKARLIELKPLKWWRAKAKHSLHAYIRARDEGKKCISCDTFLVKIGRVGGDYDAGHFRSVGSAKHLEFEEKNIFGQCKRCNDYLKGNQMAYEAGLIEREGQAFVDALKADQTPRHLTIEDYKRIDAEYKARLKILLKERETQIPAV